MENKDWPGAIKKEDGTIIEFKGTTDSNLIKQLQDQLDEAKKQTDASIDDLDKAIRNAKNNIGKPKEDPIQKIINEQNKKK